MAEINGVNARLFEAAGCGAAVLTEFRPTVPELFAVGEEVLVFHDFDDLVEQATRLLSERGLTEQLGDAAARRAHRDHTYDLRVAAILEKLSLIVRGTRMPHPYRRDTAIPAATSLRPERRHAHLEPRVVEAEAEPGHAVEEAESRDVHKRERMRQACPG